MVRNDDGDAQGLATGARMVIVAVISAAVTATLVITIGQSITSSKPPIPAHDDAVLIQTLG